MEHSGFRFFQLEKKCLSRNLGVLVDQKGSPFFFFNMKLRWNKIIEIWNIPNSDFPIGKKSTFVPKFGDFRGPKRFSNFYYFFSILSLGEIKLLKSGTFRIPIFPIGKKSTFVPEIEDFLRAKKFPDFFLFFRNEAQVK